MAAAIAREGLEIRLLAHPIVPVLRSRAGEIIELGTAQGQPESWLYLEVDEIASARVRSEVAERIETVVRDVHLAVDDWQAMRAVCLDIASGLHAQPPASVDQASVAPTVDFLRWLAADNFTFLGYREHTLETDHRGVSVLRAMPETGLGILRRTRNPITHLSKEASRTARDPRLLTITKANSRATVHRDSFLDYIGLRTFDEHGDVTGEIRFLGLFTSAAYAASAMTLPIVGPKVADVLAASGFAPRSHSGKDLLQVLEQYPRDELFQDSAEHLLEVATEVSRLSERRRTRTFMRADEFGRFISVLVYIPRDRYSSTVRLRIERLLSETFDAAGIDQAARIGDAPLAQLHFVVRLRRGAVPPALDTLELQHKVEQAVRSWAEHLGDALHARFGWREGTALLDRYGDAFPESYKEAVAPAEALLDIAVLEELEHTDFAVRLGAPEAADRTRRVHTIASHRPYPLTEVLPVLTDLGADVIDERPYTISLTDGRIRYLADFGLRGPASQLWGDPAWGEAFDDAFRSAWTGQIESDRLNSLVLLAGLDARSIVALRAVALYIGQIGSAFSVDYINQALIAHPEIAAELVRLFEVRFDPAAGTDRAERCAHQESYVASLLAGIESLDHDRILRTFAGVIGAISRTNFYQPAADGSSKPWVSMKLDCSRVPGLPKPRPMAEIWVYAPEVEGVHLRFGAISRGGLRWSDRREDFRTEVLGLVKAQMVKNAVIVPTGSKGGFVAKRLPTSSDRQAWLAAGRSAYATFVRGLLDVTDTREGSAVVPPAAVVRHDPEDSYLVVAADKGTATFSDLANSVSEEYGFWLGDAFASGGSAGYDHKSLGITARGAWESVKRHFRELGHDTQAADFTVVGVGDMSGDVFGNGMLRSSHIRLVAAFDHRHVFVDPHPDASATFTERRRLFELPGSSWNDFDRALISPGGGVFPLSAKSIDITPEMRQALGLAAAVTTLTPAQLKRAVLLAPVDLIWNGAIGTYVKSSEESQASIGDRGNDDVRVDGRELRARVVGEGGNLGVSQLGRVEAARAGVRINTDAIDNSAGVGTSDREVNIKILLGEAERAGRLTRDARNQLLQSMTSEVAAQVLRDNYEQNVLLGNSRETAVEMLPSHERLIASLEARGVLDRDLEGLPSATRIAELVESGVGLTRPEFAVLVAYSKISLKDELMLSGLAEDPWLSHTLSEYFPQALRAEYAKEIAAHPLRSEIIVNSVVNSLVNRGGITFAYRAADETGATSEQIARAFIVAREVFDLSGFVEEVERTDNVVPTSVQTNLYLTFRRLLDRAARWFVQHRAGGIDVGEEIALCRDQLQSQLVRMERLLCGADLEKFRGRSAAFVAAGVPEELARRGAGLLESIPLLDIVERARTGGWELTEFAELYFALAARVRFDDMLERVSALPQGDRWGSMARAAMRDDLYGVMIDLADSVASLTPHGTCEGRIDDWLGQGGSHASRALAEAHEATAAGSDTGLETLSVALRRLRSLVR
ncbi:NAD-glutamate dehydrogenase [Leucobacter komagatae]